jgi:hypothetical protein
MLIILDMNYEYENNKNIWYILLMDLLLTMQSVPIATRIMSLIPAHNALYLIRQLFFNTNSAIFQLYHSENKLIFNEMNDEVCFVLDQHS